MQPELILAISILIFLTIIFIIHLLLKFLITQNTAKVISQTKRVLLQIKVTKNSETGPLAAEQMFAALHGIFERKSFSDKFKGTSLQNHLSFEIASLKNNIYFFVQTPVELRDLVENQFYAQYPRVEIHEVEDFAADPHLDPAKLAMIELGLTKDQVFPIKTFPQFSDTIQGVSHDPLSAITSALSKIDNPEDQVWLQIMARPVADTWQNLGEKFTSQIKSGKDPNIKPTPFIKVIKVIFFPIIIIGKVLSFMLSTGADSETGDDPSAPEMTETQKKQNIAILEKSAKLGFEVKINALYFSPHATASSAKSKLQAVAGAFKQFNQTSLNGFKPKRPKTDTFFQKLLPQSVNLTNFKTRAFPPDSGFILNIEELATIFHLPNELVKTPNIAWVTSKKEEAPSNLPIEGQEDVTTLGITNFRNLREKFGIRLPDRKRHIYILGKTGMGKTTLLGNMIYDDIHAGKGLAYIDPHGDMAEEILSFVPSWRINDVIYFNPTDGDFPIGFNLLEYRHPSQKPLVVDAVVSVFKKQFGDSWGPRMEWVLMNTISALLDTPGTTLMGILRMYTDSHFREKIVANVKDPVAKEYWTSEFPRYNPNDIPVIVGPIQNKIGQFLSNPMMRNMLGQSKSSISLRDAMDEGKIIICNLSRGRLGENSMGLLGAMLVNKFQLEAMSRADIPEKDRKDFFLYVDEFQNFATDSFTVILSEARKYALGLCVANQYIAQMSDEVRDAVFGNVGSLITFQVGADDAEFMSRQFGEQIMPPDMADLGVGEIYVKMLVDMMPTTVFSAKTVWEPDKTKYPENSSKIVTVSRERYAIPRKIIEDKILKWSASTAAARAEDLVRTNKNRKKKGKPPIVIPGMTPKKFSPQNPQQGTPSTSKPDPAVAAQLKKQFGFDPKKFPDVPTPTAFGKPKPADKPTDSDKK